MRAHSFVLRKVDFTLKSDYEAATTSSVQQKNTLLNTYMYWTNIFLMDGGSINVRSFSPAVFDERQKSIHNVFTWRVAEYTYS